MRTKESILAEIASTEARLEELKGELAQLHDTDLDSVAANSEAIGQAPWPWPLPAEDYKRYGRQMIMPEIGLTGQLNLRKSSILIVGVGGLGCPAAAYLAGAGISRLGLVDGDTVEESNLHRQILHTTGRVGVPKVHSAVASLQQLNPNVRYEPRDAHLTPQTALELFSMYDLILDCTDHPTSRYLISDAAVLAGKPLVSASALKTDGQVVVLNHPPTPPLDKDVDMDATEDAGVLSNLGGPCYRCIFPKPPPADSVISCGEGGILGPVVGTMGVLMALEALKIITSKSQQPPPPPSTTTPDASASAAAPTNLLLFSAYTTPQFRSMRMKGKRTDCISCGPKRTITAESLNSGSLDYVAFCGVANPVQILNETERVSATELFHTTLGPDGLGSIGDGSGGGGRSSGAFSGVKPTIIDVRDKVQFELAHLPGSINIPLSRFESGQIRTYHVPHRRGLPHDKPGTDRIPYDGSPLVFVCRLGNDSQVAAQKMKMWGYEEDGRWIGDLKGGLRAWRNEVEPDWPDY